MQILKNKHARWIILALMLVVASCAGEAGRQPAVGTKGAPVHAAAPPAVIDEEIVFPDWWELEEVCTPDCQGRECGKDGCGGSCGECQQGCDCITGFCVCCEPACDGKECGDDGCGGSCGQCEGCDCVTGFCVCCQPFCFDGQQCGGDGCGGSCGKCGPSDTCMDGYCYVTTDGCEVSDMPTCGGCPCEACVCEMDPYCCETEWDSLCVEECTDYCGGCGGGNPGEFGSPCNDYTDCLSGYCVETPEGGRLCTMECIEECPPGWECQSIDTGSPDPLFLCIPSCQPNCAGKECGDDGCGGSCGWCGDAICVDFFCYAEDIPDCEGKECGPDGLGGSCGECAWGEICQWGQCVPNNDTNDGCTAWDLPTCGGCQCENCVCNMDPYCCDTQWDDICVDECMNDCGGCAGGPGEFGWPCVSNDECNSGFCVTSPQGQMVCTIHCLEDCPGDWICKAVETGPDVAFICIAGCLPDCDGKECGFDGCGGNCGECPMGFWCKDYACTDCFPDCMGKMCGDDGCGGSCGNCPAGWTCVDGVCEQ